MDFRFVIVLLHLIVVCLSDNEQKSSKVVNEKVVKDDKFEYKRTEPANELGIFSKIIAHVHRRANQTTEEWRLNRAYLPNDVYESLVTRCKTDPDDSPFKWRGCVSDEEGLFAYVTWGIPEPKNKTVTYLELEFKPFTRVNEKGVNEVCVLEEIYKTKAYVVLNTFSEIPSNDTFPRGPVESVAAVHQHQLDSFGKNFLSIFEDKIDVKFIFNFGVDEYYDRDPPYECLLNIASSESASVIEKKCDFFCRPGMSEVIPPEELEKILIEARRIAIEQEDMEEADEEDDRDILKDEKHDEL